jgi:hypothetical protein
MQGFRCIYLKLDATGSSIVYSTYLGGTGNDYGNSLAIDGLEMCILLVKLAINFPVLNARQSTYGGGVSDCL